MSISSYIAGIIVALVTLGIVIELLRRKRFRERHAIWWLVAGFFALVVGIFPNLVTDLAKIFGIVAPSNLVFFVCIAVLFLVCIQHSSELTSLESKSRILAEDLALQDYRLRQLEQKTTEHKTSTSTTDLN